MRTSQGVEWALHCCLNLSWSERAVTASRLAEFFGLPTAYLNKQLQALARAGIVTSTPGPRGGFRLNRRPQEITLLDVVVAVEGRDELFQCDQILRASPFGDPAADYRRTCVISEAMHRADLAWRRSLAAQTIAQIATRVERRYPGTRRQIHDWHAGR